jgi:hypothetical protein
LSTFAGAWSTQKNNTHVVPICWYRARSEPKSVKIHTV